MAYIGYNPSQLAVAPFAVKSFTGDGSTTTFTLDQSVPGANEANVEVVVENVQQNPIDAYTIGGALNNSLIFSEAPVSGAAIYVIHKGEATYNLQPSTGSVTASTLDPVLRNFTVDNFTGNGSATTYTLTDTPYSANSILVTVDGIVQTASTNYTVSGTTLSFGASAPDSGAVITVVHMGFSSGNKAVMDGSITPVKLSTGGLYWNTSGQVSIGNTTPRGVGGSIRALTIEGIGPSSQGISLIRNSADASASFILLTKTRGTAINANNAVTSGDSLGNIYFYGADGTTSSSAIGAAAALIVGQVDGTVSTGVVPGRLVFQTASSAGTLTERMRIDSDGNLSVGATNATGRITAIKTGKATIVGLDTTSYAASVGGTLDLGGNYRTTGDYQTFVRIAAEKTNATNADYGYNMGFYVTTNNGSTFGTKAITLTSTGTMDLPFGQIKFPASQNASSDANTLDDYEEGTWTPGWSVSGGTISALTTGTYTPGGTYTKIGNTVYIRGYISYGSHTGSPSGALAISGLPFTPGTGYGQSQTFAGGITILSGGLWLSGMPQYAQILPGSTTTNSIGYRNSGGTGGTSTTFADMNQSSNHSQFIFQGQYTV